MKIETGIVTSKRQRVIPARLRWQFGIKKGTLIAFVKESQPRVARRRFRPNLNAGVLALVSLNND